MSDEVQPESVTQPAATRPRWTGRSRIPERFRDRVLASLKQQTRYRSRQTDAEWRQFAWEAWHLLTHYYLNELPCAECKPFLKGEEWRAR